MYIYTSIYTTTEDEKARNRVCCVQRKNHKKNNI